MLHDREIKRMIACGYISVDPYRPENVQPASLDITLGRSFRATRPGVSQIVDVRKPDQANTTYVSEMPPGCPYLIEPGEFVLGSTVERIGLPDYVAARLEGRSSLGRLGLMIHSTAGFIDPGFRGPITLELSNVSRLSIAIYPGMRIGQLSFQRLEGSARPYAGKYQDQEGPTASRSYMDFEQEAHS